MAHMNAPTTTPTQPANALQRPPPSPLAQRIAADLDRQRQRGPLNPITIPPCPQLLQRLQSALAAADPA